MSRSTALPSAGRRNRTRLAALAAVTAGLGLAAAGVPALAFGAGAPTTVTYDTGSLDWGVKASFRNYVTGPVGQGAVELTGGATTNADGTFHFGLVSAAYDMSTHALSSSFTGGVRFTAHHGALDVALSDLRITTAGTAGTLTADTASKESMGATEVTRRDDVPLVTFTVARDTTNGVPAAAKLTEQGAKAFAGFYQAGSDMDPLALLLKQSPATPSPTATPTATATPSATQSPTATGSPSATQSPAATQSPTATGSPSGSPSATQSPSATGSPSASGSPSATGSPSGSPSATATGTPSATTTSTTPPAAGQLAVVDGSLDWKVKESFRKYLQSPVANGKVEFGGGAADYRFGGATGSYDTRNHTLSAGFAGSVRFLGHPAAGGYQLDTTFSKLGLSIGKDGAFLTADVNAKSLDGKTSTLSGARIAKLDLSKASLAPVNGVVTLTGVPATLTAEGVPAFANYPAGEVLDPVTVSLAFDKNAQLPTNPAGGGTTGGTAAGGTGGGTGTGTGTGAGSVGGASLTTSGGASLGGSGVLASTGSSTPVAPLLATAGGLLLAGGGATVLARRRGAARA
ncbi:HtaA domain-containing protein [Streptomyces sp. BE20]|uniref:HtaA domain-containing protein n=1 Tax=Streptomyces sp. BE20 TaxID=3002525 RepID=UPI002E775909|nr:HtaA domain-containing protein [Streptomyces sp. BE20]MEE1827778.1 HtaA domain-containing protein [Streptomyces sp. BE20]